MALIALGSNATSRFGPPLETLSAAVSFLQLDPLKCISASHFYATPCVPAGAGPDYINAVVAVQTRMSAPELLAHLHQIEADFDRKRANRWASRTLDLDLIDYGNLVQPNREVQTYWQQLPFERQKIDAPDELVLPHPRIQDRAFVLIPLCDVAPEWRHPVLAQTASEMLDALPSSEKDAISAVCPPLQTPEDLAK